jgi:hypothetical protein
MLIIYTLTYLDRHPNLLLTASVLSHVCKFILFFPLFALLFQIVLLATLMIDGEILVLLDRMLAFLGLIMHNW